MLRLKNTLLLLVAMLAPVLSASAQTGPVDARDAAVGLDVDTGSSTRPLWWFADVPLWDIADEGLPFRFTLALPSRRDPLARWTWAEENRWTFSLGYARVYNSFDHETGAFRNPGGDALLFSAGRQWVWRLTEHVWVPRIAIEFGVHYATHRFPADGTRANFKLITGLEWHSRPGTAPGTWAFGIFWPHFSNADVLTPNAGYDGLAIRFGRSFRF